MAPLLIGRGDPNSPFSPWHWLTLSSLLIKGESSLPSGRPFNADEVQF